MFVDDSACNLASINLMKFRRDDGTFDHQRFQAACRVVFIAQEILVDHASYPTKRIAANSHRFRPIGLGYSNLGSLIMTAGLPYDSDEARGLCGAITALLHGAACHTSTELAAAVGPFDAYEKNREPMLHVMEMHWEKVDEIKACPKYLQEAARDLWDKVLAHGKRHGFRNAQATVLAPTGTISFMMDCDTTGIEPDIALVKYKQLAGGGMLKIVNQDGAAGAADARLRRRPDRRDRGLHRQARHDRGRAGAEGRAPAGVRLRLPAAERQAVDPLAGAHPDDGRRPAVHLRGDLEDGEHAQGEHAGRRGRRLHGRLAAGAEGAGDLPRRVEGGAAAFDQDASRTRRRRSCSAAPRRERLPDTRQSITHKFSVSGHEGYITVGLYPDGRPGELFITMAKEGSTIGGLMDCFGTAVSMSLQYGVPLEVYVNKFSHTRFEPMGFTKNPDIKIAKSIVDYIFRWLGITFLPGFREARHKALPPSPADPRTGGAGRRGSRALARRHDGRRAERGPRIGQGQRQRLRPAAAATVRRGRRTARRNGSCAGAAATDRRAPIALPLAVLPIPLSQPSRSEQFASFQTDAPACDNCGAITVRNGNCYLCHNCGNSMGCS